MESIILIGNGPAIYEKELGDEIDKFDNIVRFNCFQTDGFEKHVGSRTTTWTVNLANDTWKVLNNRVESFIEFNDFMIVESPSKKYIKRFKEVQHLIKESYKKPYRLLHNSFYKRLGKSINANKIPSTGTMTLALLLDDYEIVTLYGFNILTDISPTHYYGGPSNIRTAHSVNRESQYINNLIKEGRVVLL